MRYFHYVWTFWTSPAPITTRKRYRRITKFVNSVLVTDQVELMSWLLIWEENGSIPSSQIIKRMDALCVVHACIEDNFRYSGSLYFHAHRCVGEYNSLGRDTHAGGNLGEWDIAN